MILVIYFCVFDQFLARPMQYRTQNWAWFFFYYTELGLFFGKRTVLYRLYCPLFLVLLTASLCKGAEQLSSDQLQRFYTVAKAGQYLSDDAKEVLLTAYFALDIDPKFIDQPYSRAARDVDGNFFNALAEASDRYDYDNLIRIPVPLGIRELVIFSLNDEAPNIASLVSEVNVGYVKGDLEAQWWLNLQQARAYPVPSEVNLLRMLETDHIDYIVAQPEQLLSALPGAAIYRQMKHSSAIWRWQTYHYVHISEPRLADLLTTEIVRAKAIIERYR